MSGSKLILEVLAVAVKVAIGPADDVRCEPEMVCFELVVVAVRSETSSEAVVTAVRTCVPPEVVSSSVTNGGRVVTCDGLALDVVK